MQNTVQQAMTGASPSNVVVFPALTPGYRLVPATIGRPGQTQVAWIECPMWCQHDHLADREVAIEDIDHYSPTGGWSVGSILDPDTAIHELYARVHSDPTHPDERLRTAHVLLGNGAPFDSYLTPDDADQAADELIKFAAQIKAAARTARLHNAAVVEEVVA
jgi:hypothetical protein